jgi:hypothetical protein
MWVGIRGQTGARENDSLSKETYLFDTSEAKATIHELHEKTVSKRKVSVA